MAVSTHEQPRHRCHVCGRMFLTGYVYVHGITRHVELCDECVEEELGKEEAA